MKAVYPTNGVSLPSIPPLPPRTEHDRLADAANSIGVIAESLHTVITHQLMSAEHAALLASCREHATAVATELRALAGAR